jgi:hypothetical protein
VSPRRRTSPRIPEERREKATLRETLDELVDHVREVVQGHSQMNPDELEYAQQRLEWLADEIWRIAIERGGEI